MTTSTLATSASRASALLTSSCSGQPLSLGTELVLLTLMAEALGIPLANACAFSRVLQAGKFVSQDALRYGLLHIPTVTLTPDFPRTSAVGRVLFWSASTGFQSKMVHTRNLHRAAGPICLAVSISISLIVAEVMTYFPLYAPVAAAPLTEPMTS